MSESSSRPMISPRLALRLFRALCSALFLLLHLPAANGQAQDHSTDALRKFNESVDALIKKVSPSVVQILVTGYGPLEEGEHGNTNTLIGRQRAIGSGFVIDPSGYIVTNAHVVKGAQRVRVVLPSANADGSVDAALSTRTTVVPARIVGASSEIDLAVIKVDAGTLPALPLASYRKLGQGEIVFAFGSPGGLRNTVTMGVVSAVARQTDLDSPMVYIQTDAPINPGNSGGPLINLRGEVIGINTAIISGSGGSQGIGFAIPSNTVRMAFESLLKQGRIIRGYLGIETPAIQRGQQEEESSGVLVTAVLPNSPAAEAQIQKGDVIQKFDGREVDNISELRHLVSQVELHKKVALDVLRNGKQIKVTAEIKEQPMNFQTARINSQQPRPLPPRSQVPQEPDNQRNESGGGLASIEVRELTPDLARTLGVPAGVHGVVVAQTDPNGGTAELRVGDVIEEINQQPISSVQDFEKVVRSLDPNQKQVLSVCRHRTRSFVVVRPPG